MMSSILMYHEISATRVGNHPYAVSQVVFEEQLQYLKTNRYYTMLLTDYLQAVDSGTPHRDKKVIITFDDTHISNYTAAFPLLTKYGFCAEFFVCTNVVGRGRNVLRKEHLCEMAKHGMWIQSHTHTHAFLSDLNSGEVYSELKISKDILEQMLNREISVVSCPGGRYNEVVLQIARQIGYKAVCVSKPGLRSVDRDIQVLGRSLISGSTDLATFRNIVEKKKIYLTRQKVEYYLKERAKSILGNRLYHKLWVVATRDSGRI